jgi:nitrite reductase/ring-hydroxylating ferredoxin subunit
MKWYKVPGIENIDQPFIKKVKAGNKSICLVGYEGEIFALSSTCPHAGEDLSRGWCKEGKLVCPVHRFSYNLHSGRGSEGQNDYVETYAVELRRDGIYIGITGFWEKVKQAFK